jgi:hypothetical protein
MGEVDLFLGLEVPGDDEVNNVLAGVLAWLGLGEGCLP